MANNFARTDPRWYQITVLASLIAWGTGTLGFGIHWQNALAILVTAQAVQWLASRSIGLPRFDPLSAGVTSLSLTLLLRTNAVELACLAAIIAIGSKFVVRVRGKHVFNPANIALATLMLGSDRVWVSSGQWGNAAIATFAIACLGMLVLTRARRAETTIAFLCGYAALLFGRAIWLGDPIAIPLHQLQNGTLVQFAFFMISDPKTAPDSRAGRIGFGALVAAAAWCVQFLLHTPNGLILALVCCAPIVPVIDALARGHTYRWNNPAGFSAAQHKGVNTCAS